MKKYNILFALIFVSSMVAAQVVCPPPPPPPPSGSSSFSSSGGSSLRSGSSNATSVGIFNADNVDANVFFNNMLMTTLQDWKQKYGVSN